MTARLLHRKSTRARRPAERSRGLDQAVFAPRPQVAGACRPAASATAPRRCLTSSCSSHRPGDAAMATKASRALSGGVASSPEANVGSLLLTSSNQEVRRSASPLSLAWMRNVNTSVPWSRHCAAARACRCSGAMGTGSSSSTTRFRCWITEPRARAVSQLWQLGLGQYASGTPHPVVPDRRVERTAHCRRSRQQHRCERWRPFRSCRTWTATHRPQAGPSAAHWRRLRSQPARGSPHLALLNP